MSCEITVVPLPRDCVVCCEKQSPLNDFCFSAAICDRVQRGGIPLRRRRDLHPGTLEMRRRQGLRGRERRERLRGHQEDVRPQGQIYLQRHR